MFAIRSPVRSTLAVDFKRDERLVRGGGAVLGPVRSFVLEGDP